MKYLILLTLFTLLCSVISDCPTDRVATMYIGKNGHKLYTGLMQGESNFAIPKEIENNSPIVASYAYFPDGHFVIGGVLKSSKEDWNSIFMWLFNPEGIQVDGWPIDTSDMEDFGTKQYNFVIGEDECEYSLLIEEKKRPKIAFAE